MQRLNGKIRHYAWGSTDKIPHWLGIHPTGEPFAEYWLGAHPSASAELDTGVSLSEAITADPGLLGSKTRDRFGDELPYLVKVLSASKALSLQTHPPAEAADHGFSAEEAAGVPIDDPKRSFKDRNAKPELALALTPFDALVGFREAHQTVALFDALGVRSSLEPIIGPLRHRSGDAALGEVFLDALVVDETRTELANQIAVAALEHVHADDELGEFARTAVQLDEQFPGDPSMIGALLMNRLRLQPGQAIHLTPGILHAYLGGTCIEVMGNSDNVLRGGLTSKHIDPAALVQVVRFESGLPEIIEPAVVNGVASYEIAEEAFAFWRIEPSEELTELPASDQPRIVVCWAGELTLSDAEDSCLSLVKGQAAFLAAGEHILARGSGTHFLTAPGKPQSEI